jgi:hypothetical protein
MRSLFVSLVIAISALGGPARCSIVPADIVKTVVFIYKGADGTLNQADGTGFLVDIGRTWLRRGT